MASMRMRIGRGAFSVRQDILGFLAGANVVQTVSFRSQIKLAAWIVLRFSRGAMDFAIGVQTAQEYLVMVRIGPTARYALKAGWALTVYAHRVELGSYQTTQIRLSHLCGMAAVTRGWQCHQLGLSA